MPVITICMAGYCYCNSCYANSGFRHENLEPAPPSGIRIREILLVEFADAI